MVRRKLMVALAFTLSLAVAGKANAEPPLKLGVDLVFAGGDAKVTDVKPGTIADVLGIEKKDVIIALTNGRGSTKKTYLIDSRTKADKFLADCREMSAGLYKDVSEGKYRYFETGGTYYSFNAGSESYSFDQDEIRKETLDAPPSDYLDDAQ